MMSYTDIRTNIAVRQKELALNIAGELRVSLSEVVRDALRAYLSSDASKVVYMTYDRHYAMVHTWDMSHKVYHKRNCKYVSGWGRAMLIADSGDADPCEVCQP